jgi:hypothetical protein
VTINNKTFKLKEVKVLLKEAIGQITPEKWENCAQHVTSTKARLFRY